MLLVLLCANLPFANLGNEAHEYDAVEFFAGVGRIAKAFRCVQKKAAAVDALYDAASSRKGSMNMLSDSGFVLLGEN